MKRFLLFGGLTYAPNGGAGDFLLDYDTLEEALVASGIARPKFRAPIDQTWYNILDTRLGLVTNEEGTQEMGAPDY